MPSEVVHHVDGAREDDLVFLGQLECQQPLVLFAEGRQFVAMVAGVEQRVRIVTPSLGGTAIQRGDKGRIPIHIGQVRKLVHGRHHALFRSVKSAFAGGVMPIHWPEPMERATEVPLVGDDLSAPPWFTFRQSSGDA